MGSSWLNFATNYIFVFTSKLSTQDKDYVASDLVVKYGECAWAVGRGMKYLNNQIKAMKYLKLWHSNKIQFSSQILNL